MGVPRGVVLAVLGADPRRRAVGAAKHDGAGLLATGHVKRLGRRIDDVVDGLHGEVHGHELDDGLEAGIAGTAGQTGEAHLGDGGVDHPLGAEFVQQSLADLIGALILGHFLAQQEHGRVDPHLLGHGVAQRLAHRLALEAGIDLLVGSGRRQRRRSGGNGYDGGRGCRNRSRCGGGQGGHILALAQQHRDDGIDRHPLGAGGNQDAAHHAVLDGFQFHGGLIGLDLGQDIAGFDGIALGLEPFGELALGHGRGQSGHQNLNRHRFPP